MKTVSFTEARNSLKSVLDNVGNDADTTVITRRDAEDAVVMSLDYYNSLMETVYLLRSPQMQITSINQSFNSKPEKRPGEYYNEARMSPHRDGLY
uniref:Antitoxin n=1 Tax=uncultured Thiotrichaceae bacterium TaxID=298394 RepID=A0A6S6TJC9_9GAMM|nr:MAG: YefM protein (antitoxin to YoeB) [uncultured Thiotrichaceae bacterium]